MVTDTNEKEEEEDHTWAGRGIGRVAVVAKLAVVGAARDITGSASEAASGIAREIRVER